jgi:hypothetical protein
MSFYGFSIFNIVLAHLILRFSIFDIWQKFNIDGKGDFFGQHYFKKH